MDWTLISAVNNRTVLEASLLASPGVRSAAEVILKEGYPGAAAAYNAAMEQAKTDTVVFVHQDIYLPESWPVEMTDAINTISREDPNWGALGVWGPRSSGEGVGYVYDGGWGKVLGRPFRGGKEVESLDEVVLICRKSAGLRFDPLIPGFHMYGSDLCLQARKQGRKCYAIGAFCIHNTNQYRWLPWAFWRAYLAMRRKWRAQLPIKTSCIEITCWCWPMLRWNLVRGLNLTIGRDKPPIRRVSDPKQIYRDLLRGGRLAHPGSQGENRYEGATCSSDLGV